MPSVQNDGLSVKLAPEVFDFYYRHPQLAGKRLVRAKQRTQFRAKSAKNDLKPTDLVNRNFYFETEGVASTKVSIMHSPSYAAFFLAGGKTHLSWFKVCEELLLNSQKGSWRRRPGNCFFMITLWTCKSGKFWVSCPQSAQDRVGCYDEPSLSNLC